MPHLYATDTPPGQGSEGNYSDVSYFVLTQELTRVTRQRVDSLRSALAEVGLPFRLEATEEEPEAVPRSEGVAPQIDPHFMVETVLLARIASAACSHNVLPYVLPSA